VDSGGPKTRMASISPTLEVFHLGALLTISGECVHRCYIGFLRAAILCTLLGLLQLWALESSQDITGVTSDLFPTSMTLAILPGVHAEVV